VKKNSPGLGVCCYDICNFTILKFGRHGNGKGCQDICRDKCFSPVTIIKTIVMGAGFWWCAGRYDGVYDTYMMEKNPENYVVNYRYA
jgi:hypothetical protein